ncbi:hypothetical protein DFH09DRAFT_1069842 [Mycena vulgaris]|nr:hypothetical protein DFH09DRAFT_1069842 [Mycena vulgaris]
MASEDVERFTLRAGYESCRGIRTASPTPPPDPSQSPTSLDFSLSSHHTSSVLDVIQEFPEEEAALDEMTARRNGKRPMTSEGDGPNVPRKRFLLIHEALKVAQLTDDSVFRSLAGVRRAMLEGLRRVESMVWQRYGIAEYNFPSVYVRHPLLYDFEAARMHTIWSVLHHQQRYTLAGLLFELLTIRLRDDFAVSHLLNAGFLDSQYPDAQYWELLPYAEINSYDFPIYEDSDEDDEMAGLEFQYPDSEDMQSISEDGILSSGVSQATSANEDSMHDDSADTAARDYSVSGHVPSLIRII